MQSNAPFNGKGEQQASRHNERRRESNPDPDLDFNLNLNSTQSLPLPTSHPISVSSTMAQTRFESMPYTTSEWLPTYFPDPATAAYSRAQFSTAGLTGSHYESVDQSMYPQRQVSQMGPPPSPWSSSVYSNPLYTPTTGVPSSPYSQYHWPPTPVSAGPSHSTFDPVSPPIPIYDRSDAVDDITGSYRTSAHSEWRATSVDSSSVSRTPEIDAVSAGSCSPVSSSAATAHPRRRSSSHRPSGRIEKRTKRPSHSVSRETSQPRRTRPMRPEEKDKIDLVRDLGACWRCRRYKKSCDGPGDCTNCLRGHFRVWPSTLGCRRGCLEDLMGHILPAQAAEVLTDASKMTIRQPNWRHDFVDPELQAMIDARLRLTNNKFERLDLKVQSTQLFGGEFSSLLEIVVKHQESQSRPNQLLEASVLLLESTCDIYHNFVASAWPLQPEDITKAVTSAQRAYASVCKTFLTSALSGRGRDWLPSYLSMCMSFVAVMIMLDAAVAVPTHARESLWGNVSVLSRDLRMRLFPTITDLLRASTNGTKPFALGCWTITPSAADQEPIRNAEGMRMVGSDKAAFDGMHRLQDWIRGNHSLVDLGAQMLRADPFSTPEIPCIAAILRLFDLQ